MRFLLDQNIERRFAISLREAGHDVRVVGVDEPAGLPDSDVLERAHAQQRILLTKDRDFGDLAVRLSQPHAGVIYLRVRATNFADKWERLSAVLESHSSELTEFVVVTDREIRIRHTS